METGTPKMLAHVENGVGWLTFNNPARRNAVSLEMWAAIPPVLHAFEADPAVRVIALTGAGPDAFVAGADISQFEAQRSSAETRAHYDRTSGEAGTALKSATKPTVAVIRGFCIGGGVGIAINCDLRFAADTARFGIPAARLGLGYASEGVKTLMDLVGPAYTKEIFFTARHFTAAEALGMGLVNRVLPEAELDSFAQAQFATVAANAPLTMHALKQTVAELRRGHQADIPRAEALVAACFNSEDYKEGRRAFMEKRRPAFQGR